MLYFFIGIVLVLFSIPVINKIYTRINVRKSRRCPQCGGIKETVLENEAILKVENVKVYAYKGSHMVAMETVEQKLKCGRCGNMWGITGRRKRK
jgi:ribosomal protein S27AE